MSKKTHTLIVLGGTSAVAMAYARHTATEFDTVCLIGRNKAKLEKNKSDLIGRGVDKVITHICDLSDLDNVEKNWAAIKKSCGTISSALIAYGVLGDQTESQSNINALRQSFETNFVSTAMWSELIFDHFNFHGEGDLTVIGSVAGDRGRQSNYHYGSAKGALEIFCNGMSHRAAHLREAKVNVLLVKPGFIDTPMTDGLDKGGPLWATPEKIAAIIDKGVKRKAKSVYAPWFWRFILLAIRMTPRFIFHKTKL